ncbi:MAG TPA: hypothetical protein DEA73_03105 [Peptococcaceae bacterium]|nr:hypothetical protein [Peptococcaceae bacterium]
MADLPAQYNKREERGYVVYSRKHGDITVENRFPLHAADAHERLQAFRRLAAQMIWAQLEE